MKIEKDLRRKVFFAVRAIENAMDNFIWQKPEINNICGDLARDLYRGRLRFNFAFFRQIYNPNYPN